MATYAISDIHGDYYSFMSLLYKIQFDPSKDELYVLGDLCDRGIHNHELLEWAYAAPASVHFLYGNHEDFMVSEMRRLEEFERFSMPRNEDEKKSIQYDFTYGNIWTWYNGGLDTYDYLCSLPREKRNDLLDWIASWPLYYDITVNDRRFVLVHAGLAMNGIRMDDGFYRAGRNELVEIEGFGEQYSCSLLWIRDNWIFNQEELPCDVVFGHTNTSFIYNTLIWDEEDLKYYNVTGGPDRILHIGKKHAIDTGRSVMGILRLDDMAEFYIDIEEDDNESD